MCKINSDDWLQYDYGMKVNKKRKMIYLKKKKQYSLLISNRDNTDNREYKSKYSINSLLLLQQKVKKNYIKKIKE